MQAIGVLALQGDFAAHQHRLEALGVPVLQVRKPAELEQVAGLVIPGGESTTLLKLLQADDFLPALDRFHAAQKPIFGTCAGLILLAREVSDPAQFSLGYIDIAAQRNAYGRQRESFETIGEITLYEKREPLPMVFIRAPRITRVGKGVTVLGTHRSEPVLAREGSVLVASFHPELTDQETIHRYFLQMVRDWIEKKRE
ncbi:MAG: pyridoxal 5'-phosphate synthase glutaminase subunit PdxT [Nitrospinota bacterium]|nr:MAG: pyridoxal 5'-phosphate synthase glutaminase subunit PdxT [Nitrospinota bacterium]